MADDTAKIARSADDMMLANHFCEFPGCVKWGGLGYDVGYGEAQWFCFEHKWDDYRLGKARRFFFDDEAAGIKAIMAEPQAAAIGRTPF